MSKSLKSSIISSAATIILRRSPPPAALSVAKFFVASHYQCNSRNILQFRPANCSHATVSMIRQFIFSYFSVLCQNSVRILYTLVFPLLFSFQLEREYELRLVIPIPSAIHRFKLQLMLSKHVLHLLRFYLASHCSVCMVNHDVHRNCIRHPFENDLDVIV